MLHFFAVMRLAAVILLSLMFLDVGMDLWQGEIGDSDSNDSNISSIYASPMPLHISAGSQNSASQDINHECFCCCSHLEPQSPITFPVLFQSTSNQSETSPHALSADLSPAYHPPQFVV